MIRSLILVLLAISCSQAGGKWIFLPGLKVSNPQWLAISFPAVYVDHSLPLNLAVNIDPGVGGLKTSLGFSGNPGLGMWSGMAIQLSAINAWGYPIWMESGDVYAGLEVRLLISYLNAGIGLYNPITSDANGIYISGTLGFGI